MTRQDTAKQIVEEIRADLTNRKGFNDIWWDLDEEIQDESLEEWESIVLKNLEKVDK